jgi:hypothetical protein
MLHLTVIHPKPPLYMTLLVPVLSQSDVPAELPP